MAVVISLLYVAQQVRQNTSAVRAAAAADAVAALREWNRTLIADGEVAVIFRHGVEGMESLDEDARARFVIIAVNLLKHFEQLHYQYSEGALDPGVWEGWSRFAALYFPTPGISDVWSMRKEMFSPSFRKWAESLRPDPVLRSLQAIAENRGGW
jgi:hypothetical protein